MNTTNRTLVEINSNHLLWEQLTANTWRRANLSNDRVMREFAEEREGVYAVHIPHVRVISPTPPYRNSLEKTADKIRDRCPSIFMIMYVVLLISIILLIAGIVFSEYYLYMIIVGLIGLLSSVLFRIFICLFSD